MKIISIDSSGLVASVAILEDTQVLAEYTINYKKTHSQTLMPMLQELGDMIELDKSTIAAVAVAAGPGSFTGLRIGCGAAKGIAQALNIPVVPVSTLKGMAYSLWGFRGLICPIMDARRNQTYCGIYRFVSGQEEGTSGEYVLQTVAEDAALSIEELMEKLNRLGEKAVFLGDGVPVFAAALKEGLDIRPEFAPAFACRQRAAVLGTLAMEDLKNGKAVSAKDFLPVYLRQSQAERERRGE